MELRKTILDNEILNTLYSTKLLPDSIGQKTDRQTESATELIIPLLDLSSEIACSIDKLIHQTNTEF